MHDPPGTAPPTDTERFADVGGGVTLCYETFGDPADPPLLLVMGLGMQMIAWDEALCRMLAERGLHVVRFDNRDAGRSTRGAGRPPRLHELALRRFSGEQYELADLAADAAGLLRTLGLGPAHVMGASMGGMIAQTLAARHPDLVRTLTSVMSMTGRRRSGGPALSVLPLLLARPTAGREGYVAQTEKVFAQIGSPGFPTEPDRRRARSTLAYDRGASAAGTGRQLGAILKSGDRRAELGRITAPTLVVHGSADRMVHPSGGLDTVSAIPDAELMTIEGMGHDLPEGVWARIVEAVAERAARHDATLAPA